MKIVKKMLCHKKINTSKHHNNLQIIHITPVHQLTSCEMKIYVCNNTNKKIDIIGVL